LIYWKKSSRKKALSW